MTPTIFVAIPRSTTANDWSAFPWVVWDINNYEVIATCESAEYAEMVAAALNLSSAKEETPDA